MESRFLDNLSHDWLPLRHGKVGPCLLILLFFFPSYFIPSLRFSSSLRIFSLVWSTWDTEKDTAFSLQLSIFLSPEFLSISPMFLLIFSVLIFILTLLFIRQSPFHSFSSSWRCIFNFIIFLCGSPVLLGLVMSLLHFIKLHLDSSFSFHFSFCASPFLSSPLFFPLT